MPTSSRRNRIGTDRGGTLRLGNTRAGISLALAAYDNRIGGDLAGQGNLIRFNLGGGVLLTSDAAQNTVVGNTLHDNEGLAAQLPLGTRFAFNDLRATN